MRFLNLHDHHHIVKNAVESAKLSSAARPACAVDLGEQGYRVSFFENEQGRKCTRHDVLVSPDHKFQSHKSYPFHFAEPSIPDFPPVYLQHKVDHVTTANAAAETLHTFAATHNEPKVASFVVRTLTYGPDSAPTGHELTLVHHGTSEKLFIDHNEIHPSKWKWGADKSTLSWNQGQNAGKVTFKRNGIEGVGTMLVNKAVTKVALAAVKGHYKFDMSTNANAFMEGDILKWDTASDEWKKATWIPAVLEWEYETKQSGSIAGKPIYKTTHKFTDVTTKVKWEPLNASEKASDLEVTFRTTARPPPNSKRSELPPPANSIAQVFPLAMKVVFEKNTFHQKFNGAILTDHAERTVVAIRGGYTVNRAIVGTYAGENGATIPKFGVAGGQLVLGGKRVESTLRGNTLAWSGLDPANEHGFPSEGEIEFAPHGHSVVRSTIPHFAAATRAPAALLGDGEDDNTNRIYELASMDPSDGKEDLVQTEALKDFYSILVHKMPSNYRDSFFPTVKDDFREGVGDIVKGGNYDKWLESLAVPYLSNQLAHSYQDDAVNNLNFKRARKNLNANLAASTDYKEIANKLYSLNWGKKFKNLNWFLNDQEVNAAKHAADIDLEMANWIAQVTEDNANSKPADRDKILQTIEAFRAPAKQGKFWAFVLCRFLYNDLASMNMQLADGNSSQSIVSDLKRYSSLLTILDPSNFFNEQYLNVVQLVQITNVLASMIDYGNGEVIKGFTEASKKILQGFIDQFISGKDKELQDHALDVQTMLANKDKEKSFDRYMELFIDSTWGKGAIGGWSYAMDAFNQTVVRVMGAGALQLAQSFAMGMGIVGIAMVCNGTYDFNSLSGTQQGAMITGGISLFAMGITKLVKGTLSLVEFYDYTASKWETVKFMFYEGIDSAANFVKGNYWQNALANWLTLEDSSIWVQGDSKLAVTLFGRNLSDFMATRFAAAMAIVGIVFSAFALATSSSAYETAMNSLLLSSAVLDLTAAISTWILSVNQTIIEMEGIAADFLGSFADVLGVIAGCAGALAIAAALAGLIMLLVMIFKPPEPAETEVHKFTFNDAKDKGFFMEFKTEIDFFNDFRDSNGIITASGVSFRANGDKTKCLHVTQTSDAKSFGVDILSFLNSWSAIYQLDTDGDGYSTIATRFPSLSSPPIYLTMGADKKLSFAPKITDSATVSQQKWKSTILGEAKFSQKPKTKDSTEMVDDYIYVQEASFNFYNKYWEDTEKAKYYLQNDGSVNTATDAVKFHLVKEKLRPEGLSMDDVNVSKAYGKNSGTTYYPHLPQNGTAPLTYTLSPALPDFLQFNPENKGVISIKPQKDITDFPKTQYTLTVTNSEGSTSTTFYIQTV